MLDARSWWAKRLAVCFMALCVILLASFAWQGCSPATGGNTDNNSNDNTGNDGTGDDGTGDDGTGLGTITGTVVDATNPGSVIDGAQLYVYTPPSFRSVSMLRGRPGSWLRQSGDVEDQATTGDDGAYTMPSVRSGVIQLAVQPPAGSGFAPLQLGLDVPDDGNLNIRITLVPNSLSSTIAGIEITPAMPELDAGAEQQFTAVVIDVLGRTREIAPTWIATNRVGTIDEDGLFTAGDEAGAGAIIAVAGPRSAATRVSVAGSVGGGAGSPVIDDISLYPGDVIPPGASTFIYVMASDPDEDWLFFDFEAPDGGTLRSMYFPDTIEFEAPDEPGQYEVICHVEDGANTVQQTVTITVDENADSEPPIIEDLWASNLQVMKGEVVWVECWAYDPEGTDLTYVWSANDGRISAVPEFPDDQMFRLWNAPGTPGMYEITVEVMDEGGASTTETLVIEVLDEGDVGGDLNVGVS